MTTLETIRTAWIQQAVDYMIELSLYSPDDLKGARELAETLWESSDNEDVFMDCTRLFTAKDAVDEELTYWGD